MINKLIAHANEWRSRCFRGALAPCLCFGSLIRLIIMHLLRPLSGRRHRTIRKSTISSCSRLCSVERPSPVQGRKRNSHATCCSSSTTTARGTSAALAPKTKDSSFIWPSHLKARALCSITSPNAVCCGGRGGLRRTLYWARAVAQPCWLTVQNVWRSGRSQPFCTVYCSAVSVCGADPLGTLAMNI